jgi:hypothetical protein
MQIWRLVFSETNLAAVLGHGSVMCPDGTLLGDARFEHTCSAYRALARQRRSNQNLIGGSMVRATMVWAVARPTNPDLSLHGCMHRTQTQIFFFSVSLFVLFQ